MSTHQYSKKDSADSLKERVGVEEETVLSALSVLSVPLV